MRKKYAAFFTILVLLIFMSFIIFIVKRNRIERRNQKQFQMEEQKKQEERWKIIKVVTGERKEIELFRTLKEEMDGRKRDAHRKVIEKELEEKKTELTKICEENQEELELISEEIFSMLETDGVLIEGMTWEIAEEKMKQIKNTEWDRLSEQLQPLYPFGEKNPEGKVYYCYWAGEPYVLKALYIRDEGAEEYLQERFSSDEPYIKINEHLYVCVEDCIYGV